MPNKQIMTMLGVSLVTSVIVVWASNNVYSVRKHIG